MLGGVGEAFGDDVVEGRFDRLVETLGRYSRDLDGKWSTPRECLESGLQPSVGEDCRMEPTG